MMRYLKKITVFLLFINMLFSGSILVYGATNETVNNALQNTAEFMLKTVSNPQVGSVGGEWTIIGLARSNYDVPQSYYDNYYKTVEKYVVDLKGNLHDKKYTEYSRVTLALTAIGKDPSNIGGYNLLEPLGDFDKTIWQGVNGPIFALIALDSGEYEIPVCSTAKTQATREMYIDEILSRQLSDGGFALSGNQADPDITGMALQALAKYQHLKSVKTATDEALECLSKIQNLNGGYASRSVDTSESTVQVLLALCELGIDVNDSRFVKNGKNIIDDLMSYYSKDQGFQHTSVENGVTGMSTEQGFYGLVAYQRVSSGKTGLYVMADIKKDSTPKTNYNLPTDDKTNELSSKSKDVKIREVINKGKTFSDIVNHTNKVAIEDLASRGIINGVSDTSFAPDKTMTRAEFATIIVNGLGLSPKAINQFTDVSEKEWYAAFIGTAYTYKLVNGTSANTFAPNNTITRQEAAIMITNAAELCGLDTNMGTIEIRDTLAQFGDYTRSADWARSSLAFCYKLNILDQSDMEIEPLKPVTRADVAEMLYRLLQASELI